MIVKGEQGIEVKNNINKLMLALQSESYFPDTTALDSATLEITVWHERRLPCS